MLCSAISATDPDATAKSIKPSARAIPDCKLRLARFSGQLLGVIDERALHKRVGGLKKLLAQNTGAGHNGAGQATSSSFIDTNESGVVR